MVVFFMENFYKLIEDFETYAKLERGLSINTVINYRYDLEKFYQFIKDDLTSINQVRDTTIREFIYSLDNKYSSKTQSRIISSLNTFFMYLLLEEIVSENPIRFIEHPKAEIKLPVYLTLSEIELIMDQIDRNTYEGDRNYVILEMLYSCGLRVSELTALRISDLFLEEDFIRVLGKGNKQRLVPIANQTKELIEDYIKYTRIELVNDNYVTDVLFLNRRGKPLTRAMIFTIVKNAARMSEVRKEVSPHTFRHSFATHLLENGANLFAIQAMLGHESITTTEIYTHIENSALKQVISEFHPWVKQKKEAN